MRQTLIELWLYELSDLVRLPVKERNKARDIVNRKWTVACWETISERQISRSRFRRSRIDRETLRFLPFWRGRGLEELWDLDEALRSWYQHSSRRHKSMVD